MKQIDLREGSRRQHRAVALFAVLQCWVRGLDGVAFTRQQLERLLGLKRFKGTRHDWMEEDFGEFFPFTKTFWRGTSLGSYFVSRTVLDKYLSGHKLTTEARIAGIVEGGPRIGAFKMWTLPSTTTTPEALAAFLRGGPGNANERLLHTYLSLLSQGQVAPERIACLVREEGPTLLLADPPAFHVKPKRVRRLKKAAPKRVARKAVPKVWRVPLRRPTDDT